MEELSVPSLTAISVAIGSMLTQLFIMGAAWFKFKSEIRNRTNEIKYHADISVQKLNGMLTSVIMSFDRPAWIKIAEIEKDGSVKFRMLEMNDFFGEMHGIKRGDYIGKTDLEAGITKELADVFYQHDISVYASGETKTVLEKINGKNLRFRKIRIVSPSNNKIKGVMGYAIDCEDPKM